MAMALNSATVPRIFRSSSWKAPSLGPFTSSITPSVRSLKVSGTQRIDLVWKREALSKRLANRGSAWTFFTRSGWLFCATQPAIPSPGWRRMPRRRSDPDPTAAWKYSSPVAWSFSSRDQLLGLSSSLTFARMTCITSPTSSDEVRAFPISLRTASSSTVRCSSRRRSLPLIYTECTSGCRDAPNLVEGGAMNLLLCSASPRRREFLERLGVRFSAAGAHRRVAQGRRAGALLCAKDGLRKGGDVHARGTRDAGGGHRRGGGRRSARKAARQVRCGAHAATPLWHRASGDHRRVRAARGALGGDRGDVRAPLRGPGPLAGRLRRRRRQGRSVRGPGAGGRVRRAARRKLHQRGGPATGRDAGDAGGSRRGPAVDVAAGLARVRERIAAACSRAGRDPASVRLVAVSKTKPVELLRAAQAAGQAIFGENYAQDLREKADALPGVEWHFIGALQTNKAKLVVGRAALIHTCDRIALAQELSKRAKSAGLTQRVLLEVNVGREPQKVRALPSLAPVGLMCIPPAEVDPRAHFRSLRQLGQGLGLTELSMGMSGDYEIAIEEGATLVRVGTAIFGERAP